MEDGGASVPPMGRCFKDAEFAHAKVILGLLSKAAFQTLGVRSVMQASAALKWFEEFVNDIPNFIFEVRQVYKPNGEPDEARTEEAKAKLKG